MCGRYTDTKRDKQFLARMGIKQAEIDFVPRYNLAPTQSAAIVVSPDAQRFELRRARWGLIPSWAKEEKIGSSLINARAETIASKPAFRTSFRRRRCLVLADGFFEWQRVGAGKLPVYIRMKDCAPFLFGGLWDRWNDIESFAIITVEPNPLLAGIHTRMPLILGAEQASTWLDPQTTTQALTRLLRPYEAGEMEFFPVSKLVNTAQPDSPECIERADTLFARRERTPKAEEPLLPGFSL